MKTLADVLLASELVKFMSGGQVEEEVAVSITSEDVKSGRFGAYEFKDGGKLRGVSAKNRMGFEIETDKGTVQINLNVRFHPGKKAKSERVDSNELSSILSD